MDEVLRVGLLAVAACTLLFGVGVSWWLFTDWLKDRKPRSK